jgi:UDP-3-O-[3-hydroxymyristoyl] N-acetylglucosamine deacetylase
MRNVLIVDRPVFLSKGEIHLVALPASSFQISYTMHYPHSPLLKSQYYSFVVTADIYRQEIAPCRTFSLYEEVLPLIEKGLICGGGLNNAVVIDGEKVLNPGGLRFPDEMVRHKVLDVIGDLSLVGARLCAHVIAIRSGHVTNALFAKLLTQQCALGARHG